MALPSEVVSSDDDDFLTDAVPKTISTYLAQVEGLETKLPPTALQVQTFAGDLDRLASTYGVQAIVMSTITAQAERLILLNG